MDQLYKAADLEMMQRDIGVHAQLKKSRLHMESLNECEDCQIEIPEKRRAIGGITRCVECQGYADKERHLKGFR